MSLTNASKMSSQSLFFYFCLRLERRMIMNSIALLDIYEEELEEFPSKNKKT